MTLSDLKDYVESHVAALGVAVDSDVHQILTRFVEFVDKKQTVADAVALLTAEGYTVAPPVPVLTDLVSQ